MVELGSDWVIQRHLVRETAIVLWGPPPQTLLDPVLKVELRAAVIDRVTNYWNQQLDHPAELPIIGIQLLQGRRQLDSQLR